jgi:hypothetical protein
VGGPWFTVQESSSNWQVLDSLWLSNGQVDVKARVEVRVSLEGFTDLETTHDATR